MEFESQYMMMIPLTIILQSCFGSIVVFYVLANGGKFFLAKLAIATILCMTYNAAILAQLKAKYVYALLYVSLILNSFILILTALKI